MRVLIVEDHADVADTVSDYLTARGHRVDIAKDGERGLNLATEGDYDALVLDRILPRMDGATVCGRLRNEAGKATPVLMLTALTSTTDKLTGFAAGADDYLTKPFDLAELEVRLLALCRRASGQTPGHRLQVGDLIHDTGTLHTRRGGRPVVLSPTGRRVLEFLMRHAHRVVARSELEQHLWGDALPEAEVLRVHIHALRTAIDGRHRVKLLHTVRGVGYRLTADAP